MTKTITPFDLAAYSPLVDLFATPSAQSVREPGPLEYDSALSIAGTTRPISPFDPASYDQVRTLANSSPPTNDARGTAWSSTGRGSFKYDAGLQAAKTPKFISPFDLACFCGLVNWPMGARPSNSPSATDLRGSAAVSVARCTVHVPAMSPVSADLRGTTIVGGARELGALEYDPSLTAGGGGGGVSRGRIVGGT